MSHKYNPVVRTFGQVRAALVSSLGLARHEVRPETPLDEVIPVSKRREVWRCLRRQGLRVPGLELPAWEVRLQAFAVAKLAATFALFLRRWSALLVVFPLWLAAYWLTRPRAVNLPLGLRTVGEL